MPSTKPLCRSGRGYSGRGMGELWAMLKLNRCERRAPGGATEAREQCQRLTDDLIHVVVAIGRETADEMDIGRLLRQLKVTPVQCCVRRPRHRIIGISRVGRKLIDYA